MNDVKNNGLSKRKIKRINIYSTAEYLIKELKKHNIIIQRYNSKTSNSIYLKLDYGVLDTIRISDHLGKKDTIYKYNILTNCKNPTLITNKTIYGETKQYFFPLQEKKLLAKIICEKRKEKIKLYGEKEYKNYMQIKIAENYAKTGFWKNGEII